MRKKFAAVVTSRLSWSKLGRSAEMEVAILLVLFGWNVRLSPGSRGPADLFAQRKSEKWLIQVKSSGNFGRLKGVELKKLQDLAKRTDGLPVIALLQPRASVMAEKEKMICIDDTRKDTAKNFGKVEATTRLSATSLGIFFHSLVDWTIKQPF
jgi:Holliday junction resolvase